MRETKMEVSTHLSATDRRRWAKLVEWVKYSKSMTNVQLGVALGCSNSTISDWINEKRSELHDDKLARMAKLLHLTKGDLLKLVQEDDSLSFAHKIELMRSAEIRRKSKASASVAVEEVLNNVYSLPASELLRVIDAAATRLNNLSTVNRSDFPVSSKLCQEHRIKISKLVWASADYRETKGGIYEKGLDILKTTPFLREILSAQGNDFFLSFSDLQCILDESLKQAIVAFCYVAKWDNGRPFVVEPASHYADFDEMLRSFSQEQNTTNCCQRQ